MDTSTLTTFSDQLAAVVDSAGASVVQVQGRHRPVSGVAYAADIVLTSARALGREDGVTVTSGDGRSSPADLVGWDPATGLAVLRVAGLDLKPARPADVPSRVGQIAVPIARSWSNALTASAGIVAVIGGPLRTGRGQSIEQIVRITAPMHDGFAGGAVADAAGLLIGIATRARIRGLAVVIPAAIAWKSAAHVLEHGRPRVGYLGISGQPVRLAERQRGGAAHDRGLLVAAVSEDGPAEAGGILLGDVIVELDGQPVASVDGLLSLLSGARVGRAVVVRVLRGGAVQDVTVTVGERPAS
ncbi:MAG TPA: S1C family serine protease [Vicinamibacterales bacterium]|nr:S1C family serine protease [Vicinamibacterales bacterium]